MHDSQAWAQRIGMPFVGFDREGMGEEHLRSLCCNTMDSRGSVLW